MITAPTLEALAQAAGGRAPDEALLAELRRQWPDLRLTLCSDNDVPARLPPALEGESFNLYLVNGSEHCLSLTNDPEVAIGVVLAWRDED